MSQKIIPRLMPPKMNLGQFCGTCMTSPMGQYREMKEGEVDIDPEHRYVMGYKLPLWQRPLVWDQERSVRLIESIWKGIGIGTYTYYQSTTDEDVHLDGLLIDGQQRLHSIQEYLEDEFPVHGYYWSELTIYDQRDFKTRHFNSYIMTGQTEEQLKEYYNLLNFGGVAHDESQRV